MVEMENMCQICLLKFGKENCRLYASHEVYYGCFVIFDWIKRFWMLYQVFLYYKVTHTAIKYEFFKPVDIFWTFCKQTAFIPYRQDH